MTHSAEYRQAFNILIIAQAGRLEYEALLFASSLKASNPEFKGQLFVAVPQGDLWRKNTALQADSRELLEGLGAIIVPFT